MKKPVLYIFAALLFLFAATALVGHISRIPNFWASALTASSVPFSYAKAVVNVRPAAYQAGLRAGDAIKTMNGRPLTSNSVFFEETKRAGETGVLNLTVERKAGDGTMQEVAVDVPVQAVEKNVEFYARAWISVLFVSFVPAFCIAIGFWVVFVRIDDFLAWLLLFVMLGFSAIGFEGSPQFSAAWFYVQLFSATWAPSMLLFAIYFPERFSLDRRAPWLKWIFLVPLALQVLFILISIASRIIGVEPPSFLASLPGVGFAAFVLNISSIALFFAILGWKSGTLENPDSRRRLRLMTYGTMLAMLPAFLILVYGLISGVGGSFYDRAHWLVALIALLMMPLFPLTLAYVIVVHRAMDVRVVVRQGIQYAFASGGVRVVQFLLLIGIGSLVFYLINNYAHSLWIEVVILVAGAALVPLVEPAVRPVRAWIDRRFFRDAYDAEKLLAGLSEDVRTMVETRPLLETVATTIASTLHVPQIAVLLRDGTAYTPAYAAGYDIEPKVALRDGSRAMKKLADDKPIFFYEDMSEVTAMPIVSESDREQLRELNTQLLLPLSAKNELSGILSLSPKLSEEPYTPSDIRLLRSVASQTGLALENSRLTEEIAREAAQKERLSTELEIAREVQERLFPQEMPRVEGLDIFGFCRPALGVGGDYYDFLELDGGKIGIAIGDISGKGVGASLMMASLQASLRGQSRHFGDDLAALMKQINELVYEASTSNRYATFFYGQFDPATGLLSYVNAGHNPPFLLRAGGDVENLEEGGPVVGMLPAMIVNYSMGSLEFRKGDILVGFTDGISEAMNPEEEEWGEDALLELLKKHKHATAAEIIELSIAAADQFARGAKQHDDMTMIVVKAI